MKTVGELLAFIENLPKDMPIVQFQTTMEKSGCFNSCFAKVEKRSPVEHSAWDRFDGGDYTYESYDIDENGKECLVLY